MRLGGPHYQTTDDNGDEQGRWRDEIVGMREGKRVAGRTNCVLYPTKHEGYTVAASGLKSRQRPAYLHD